MPARVQPTAVLTLVAFGLVGACFVDVPGLAEGPAGASGAAGTGGVAGMSGSGGTSAGGTSAGGSSAGGTGAEDGGAGAAGIAGAAGTGGSAVDAGDAGEDQDAGNGVPPECTTSFFVANDGDDASQGTLDAPWKTLGRLATASFEPGDCILLRRGDIWMSPLDVAWSGAQGAPIIIGAYGFGNAPVVREVSIVERDYVTLQGVRVSGANVTGVALIDSQGITVQDCEVEFAVDSNVLIRSWVWTSRGRWRLLPMSTMTAWLTSLSQVMISSGFRYRKKGDIFGPLSSQQTGYQGIQARSVSLMEMVID